MVASSVTYQRDRYVCRCHFKGWLDKSVARHFLTFCFCAAVATVGLGLTIPLAFGSDLVMGKPDVLTPSSIFGALTVLLGFVLVNAGNGNEPNSVASMADDSPLELSRRPSASENDVETEDTLADRTID